MNSINKSVLALIVVAATLIFAIPMVCEGFDSQDVIEEETFSTDDGLEYQVIEGTSTVSLIGYTDDFNPTEGFDIPSIVSHEGATYTVRSVGDEAFHYCTSLKGTLTIPGNIEKIGKGAFAFTNLTSIVVDVENEYYCSVENILFNKDMTTLVYVPCHKETGAYVVPKSVTRIDDYAFEYNLSLTEIVFNDSLTEIGDYAFNSCVKMTGTLNIPGSVTTIGEKAFQGCGGITGLVFNDGLTEIGRYAFYMCEGLTGTLNIPGSVEIIGDGLFAHTELNSILVDDGNKHYCSVDGVLFDKDMTTLICAPSGLELGSYTVPGSVTRIGDSAFEKSPLTGIVLNDGLVEIGDNAFIGCRELTGTLEIPGSVKTIGANAFFYCAGLTGTLEIPGSVTTIGEYAFSGCGSLTGLVLNDGLVEIGLSAFEGCSKMSNVLNIPKSVKEIGEDPFYGTRFSYITVDPLNENYSSQDGVLFNKDKTVIIFSAQGMERESYTIPYGVTKIYSHSFKFSEGLTGTLKIPGSVKRIGGWTFDRCKFTAVSIDGDVTGISKYAFDGWTFYDTDGVTKITDMNDLPGWNYAGTPDKMVRQTPVVKATIGFDTDGGTGSVASITASALDVITLPKYDGTKSKCTFEGWSLDGKTYKPGQSYTVEKSVTFMAVWKENGGSSNNTMLIAGAVVAIIAIIAIAAVVVYKKKKP